MSFEYESDRIVLLQTALFTRPALGITHLSDSIRASLSCSLVRLLFLTHDNEITLKCYSQKHADVDAIARERGRERRERDSSIRLRQHVKGEKKRLPNAPFIFVQTDFLSNERSGLRDDVLFLLLVPESSKSGTTTTSEEFDCEIGTLAGS